MKIDWNFLLSVITIIVASYALIQIHHQMKLSNKQHLFDKRMENYLIAMGLIQLYRNNCKDFDKDFDEEKDEPIFALKSYFIWLTNNTYLEEITTAIDNPLKNPGHKEFLIKLEKLKEVGTKIKFLFPDNASDALGDFVFSYQELLFSMYQYQILLNNMYEINKDHKLSLEEIQQKFGEPKHRLKLQRSFQNLKQADDLLKKKNVEEKIKNQIKLL